MTRGYSAVDEDGVVAGDPRTEVVESLDADGFEDLFARMLETGSPDG
jgi:purine nucleosidase